MESEKLDRDLMAKIHRSAGGEIASGLVHRSLEQDRFSVPQRQGCDRSGQLASRPIARHYLRLIINIDQTGFSGSKSRRWRSQNIWFRRHSKGGRFIKQIESRISDPFSPHLC
jgi:hypothetical protein